MSDEQLSFMGQRYTVSFFESGFQLQCEGQDTMRSFHWQRYSLDSKATQISTALRRMHAQKMFNTQSNSVAVSEAQETLRMKEVWQ